MAIQIVNTQGSSDANVRIIRTGDDLGEAQRELAARGFEAKFGQSALVGGNEGLEVLLAVGDKALDVNAVRKLGAALSRAAWRISSVSIELPELADASLAQSFSEGVTLGAYQFNTYKTESKPSQLEQVFAVGANESGLRRGEIIAKATIMARDLQNEPAATMTPLRMAEIAQEVASANDLAITVWDEEEIERQGMGGLLGVAIGSEQPAQFIQLKYQAPGATQTVGLVGKGITFDSGGLSLKPSDGMTTMKTDMSGAAAVLATMSIIRQLEIPVNVNAYLCCTENMPSGSATKIGDVLTMRNKKTVEVLNTDAEGRLVLGDGLAIAVEDDVDAVFDIATLTGAAVVALGREYSCIMGNNEQLLDAVQKAGDRAGEPSWPLPLPESYRKHIDSEIADMKNMGKAGEAGTIAGGMFLKEYVGDKPWVHIDIAGPSRMDADEGIFTKGGTGVGVRTFVELLREPLVLGD